MNTKELIESLEKAKWEFECALETNGGELTLELEELEGTINNMQESLRTDGVDDLGRWLKGIQDDIATAKDEAAAAQRRVKGLQNYETYVKGLITQCMRLIGQETVKGKYYSFTQREAVKTTIIADALNDKYLEVATKAAHAAGLPEYIDVALKTTTTLLRDNGETDVINEEHTPSILFRKPRKSLESQE